MMMMIFMVEMWSLWCLFKSQSGYGVKRWGEVMTALIAFNRDVKRISSSHGHVEAWIRSTEANSVLYEICPQGDNLIVEEQQCFLGTRSMDMHMPNVVCSLK
jgi:hypothetical protein